ncbi:unnamed protein product [Absidia cylindrospora]
MWNMSKPRLYLLIRTEGCFPCVGMVTQIQFQWLYGDVICAITIGIIVIPQSMAYAQMAGFPPQYGLYSSVIGCFVYPLIGTSKDISIGTTAINSLLVGQIMAILVTTPEFQNGTWTIPYITSNLTLICGIICLAVSFLRLGILFDFICQPAIAGFMAGSAVTIVVNQLHKILGIHDVKTTEPTYLIFGNTLKHLPETQWDAALGVPGLLFLYAVKYGAKMLVRRYPKYSKQLTFISLCRNIILIVLATLFSFLINHFGNYTESPFKLTGNVPAGFQNMGVPTFDTSMLSQILPNLVGVVVLQIMEHCSIATSLGKVTDYKINVNQEISSIGLSNIFGSFFGAYPMTGSFCRSALMSKSGCRTPLTNLLVGAIVILTMYCFTPALLYIPEAAIGAIVCHAVTDLITGPKVWVKFWNTNPSELVIFAAAYLIALFTRIDISVYVPVAISIVVQLYRMSRPKYAFLGRLDLKMDDTNDRQQTLPLSNTRKDGGDDDEKQKHVPPMNLTTPQTMFFPLADPVLQGRVRPIAPGIVCFQPREDLVFENVNYLYAKLMDEVKKQTRRGIPLSDDVGRRPWNDAGGAGEMKGMEKPLLSSIIFDLSGVHVMDYTAMEALVELSRMVDRYCGSPIPWYIVVGSSEMVRHVLLYAGFGRQQRKKVPRGIFTFHNDIKKKKHNNKSSNHKAITTVKTSMPPTTSGKQECPHMHDLENNDKKEYIATMTIEDVTDRRLHHQQQQQQQQQQQPAAAAATTTVTSPNTPSATHDSPAPFLPEEDFEKAKSFSTVSSDQFDEYPPWCYCQDDDDDDDDDYDDNGHDHGVNGMRDINNITELSGPIACIRDRYPYFFLSLHDAVHAALCNADSSSSQHTLPPMTSDIKQNESVTIEMASHQ